MVPSVSSLRTLNKFVAKGTLRKFVAKGTLCKFVAKGTLCKFVAKSTLRKFVAKGIPSVSLYPSAPTLMDRISHGYHPQLYNKSKTQKMIPNI